MDANEIRLLTARDLARLWQMDASTVYRIMRSGEIPVVRFGKNVRVTPADAIAFVRASRRTRQTDNPK